MEKKINLIESTDDAMVYITELWNRRFHDFDQTLVLTPDISKALGIVWQKSLVNKLKDLGIGLKLNYWIAYPLSKQSIWVVLDGTFTERYHLEASGVPQ